MNLAGIDLNLLLVFDAVMKERNATRAGMAIGMSQPAVSNALNRLRHIMKDDLFVRGPDGMRPTSRAQELANPIRHALAEIEEALNPASFDPANAERTFVIATTDYASMTLMPYLASYISDEAPKVNIHTIPIQGRLYEKLDSQEADFGITALSETPERFGRMDMHSDEFVVMMRPDHPLARHKNSIPLEEYSAARHLLVTPRGDARGFMDEQLEKRGLKRQISMTINSFGPGPMIVMSSDLILTIPSRMAGKCAQFFDLHIMPSPIQPPKELTGGVMIWHNRLTNHPAHTWFRQLIKRASDDFIQHGFEHYMNVSLDPNKDLLASQ
ncbi:MULTISPECIES: LysR family transcriptional regulator [Kordiimonas]|uniref:LysR family transcriptional regulator n=1 Tax=Kordiimonas TaxID=288021 RepID=UPI001FF1F001|nr:MULTISPECIES: LysR family transcriptional regulator [Kordiimonas]MCK0068933.1 LysR family transcriptional regulator [Kordiimonas laminariae]UTW58281.1 LysR family transcriptional regulator [Kordiimonas sp. SCSIO 12603]